MFTQIPNPPPGAIESTALALAAIASLAVLGKKVLGRKPQDSDLVRTAEFHRELNALRDKIDARHFSLSEKIDLLKADLLTAAEQRSSALHQRINELESGLARVDERTRNPRNL